MGLDKRIGLGFLNAGLGYGGSCFPKDLDAFINIAEKLDYDFRLLKAVKQINDSQKEYILKKIKDALWIIKGKAIGILGLSFKPNTDDIRNAPSLAIIRALQQEGARIKIYDPSAMPGAKKILPGVKFCRDSYEAASASDCLLIVTEWDEFKELDFARIKKLLKRPLIIDGRNIYDPQKMHALGFTYIGVGIRKYA
jgi:UDPglucose 6-dehydrogenase